MFKEKIKKLRESNSLSQKELSKKLNISKRKVVKWERGKCIPNEKTLEELCTIFEIASEELLGRKEIIVEIEKLEIKRKKVVWFILGLIIPIVLFLISLLPLFSYVGFCLWVQPPKSIFNILFLVNEFIPFLTIAIYLYVFVFSFIYWNKNLKRGNLIQIINISIAVILFIVTVIIVSNYAVGIAYGPIMWY